MKGEIIPTDPSIAYIIPNQAFGLNLEVKKTANAWWWDRQKVYNLLAAFSLDCTIQEACAYTGITVRQYKYFQKLHPVINEIRSGVRLAPIIKARITIFNALDKPKIAQWLLERKRPEEFGPLSKRKNDGLRAWEDEYRPPTEIKITYVGRRKPEIPTTFTHVVNGVEYTDEEFLKLRSNQDTSPFAELRKFNEEPSPTETRDGPDFGGI